MIVFKLLVEPRTKARGRASRTGKKCPTCSQKSGALIVFTPKDTRAYEESIRLTCLGIMRKRGLKPLEGPISIRIVTVSTRPKRLIEEHPGRHWKPNRPDIDNSVKAILDSLNGVCFADDAQIVQLEALNLYAAIDEAPRVEIMVCAAPVNPPGPKGPKPAQEALL